MIGMCNFLHYIIVCFYWLNTSKKNQVNNNCVRKVNKILRKMRKEERRGILHAEYKNCLETEFDHISAHIF